MKKMIIPSLLLLVTSSRAVVEKDPGVDISTPAKAKSTCITKCGGENNWDARAQASNTKKCTCKK